MTYLTLDIAVAILDAALAKADAIGAKPLCVVVLDAGGHPLALKRHEAASLFRADIATAKAQGALGIGSGSRTLAERADISPNFFASLSAATGGRMVLAPGGVLIRDDSDRILGAVGISGDTSDNDERCAISGIETSQFRADPGGKQHA